MAQNHYTILTKWIEQEAIVAQNRYYYENDTLVFSIGIDSQGIRDTLTTEDYNDLGIFNFSSSWGETLRSNGIKIEHCELAPIEFERLALLLEFLDDSETRKNDKTKKGKRIVCFYGPLDLFLKYSAPARIKKETLIINNGLLTEETTIYLRNDTMGRRTEKRNYYYDTRDRLIYIKYSDGSMLQIIYE